MKTRMNCCFTGLPIVLLLLFAGRAFAADSAYDPLRVPDGGKGETLDLVVNDAKRKRDIPLRIYLPPGKSPTPVVLFSHGLGGSREGCVYLGRHWAARGYVAVFLQHPGSDTSVWQDKPLAKDGGDAGGGKCAESPIESERCWRCP